MATPINRYQNIITPQPALNRVQAQQQRIVDTSGQGLQVAGEAIGQYADIKQKEEFTREKANQELWLASREAQDRVAAKKIYDAATKAAQSGGKIKETIEKEWSTYTQKQQEQTKDNPFLNTAYASQLARIKGTIDLQADEWETTEQSRYTVKTTEDAAENMKRGWEELPDAAQVNKQFQDDVARLNKIIEAAELDPAEKDKLRNILKKDMPDAAMSVIIDKSPYVVAAYGGGNFNYAVSQVLGKEGGYVANDAGAGETNFGINKTANPDIDVKNLTKEKAIELYRERYWNAIGADKLPPDLAYVAFDAAVNQGVGAAKEMLEKANGDVGKFVQLREERYKETAKNPEKAVYLDLWLARNNQTLQEASGISAYKMGTLEQRMGWKEKAERKIVAREAESRRQVSLGESYIKTIEDRLSNGMTIPPTEMATIQQQIGNINNPVLNQKWAETTEKASAQKEYLQMTPMALQNHISQVLMPAVNSGGATSMEAAKLDIAQKTLTNTMKMADENPLGLIERQGVTVPPLDFTNPDSMIGRMTYADQLSATYGSAYGKSFFQPAEKAYVENYLSNQPFDKVQKLAQNFVAGMGPKAPLVAEQFEKSAPGFAYAVGVLASDPSQTGTANAIIEGSYALKRDPKLAPKESEYGTVVDQWQGYIADPAQFSATRDAAIAIYVARNGTLPFDADKMKDAMSAAVGGGERVTINGTNTVSPPGVTAQQFEDFINSLTIEKMKPLTNFSVPYYVDSNGKPKAQFNTKDDKIRPVAIAAGVYQLYGPDKKKLAGGESTDAAAIMTVTKQDVLRHAKMGGM